MTASSQSSMEGRQSKQLAQKFLQKAPSLLRNGGNWMPSAAINILQNQTDDFQCTWLREVTLKRSFNWPIIARVIQDAICPAFIALFMNTPPRATDTVEFSAPKFNKTDFRKGIITVSPIRPNLDSIKRYSCGRQGKKRLIFMETQTLGNIAGSEIPKFSKLFRLA